MTFLTPVRPTRWLVRLGGTGLALAGLAAPGSASARPPSAEDFQITYFTTDADGSRGTQMTVNDLQSYVNRARCQCGQEVQAEVRLQVTSGGEAIDQGTQIRTFMGNRCDVGQSGLNPTVNPPCALGLDAFPQTYSSQSPPRINFQPIFLAHGVTQLNADVGSAESVGNCLSGQGNAGVWICAEDGAQTDCQVMEFVVTGTQNTNVPMGESGQGFTVDFQPPSVVVTNFTAEGGDGSLLVSWDQATATDVEGYRILCADANDNPLPGRGFRPSGPNYGQFYYTQNSLCPDGPFNDVPENPNASTDPVPSGTTGGGTGGDSGTGGDGTGGGTGSAFDGGFAGGGPSLAPEDCCQPNSLMEPGCNEASCEFSVCNSDPSCCENSWDMGCVSLANDFCQQCGGLGDCCLPNPTASCSDSTCRTLVCADNPSCCTVQWTQACADTAAAVCSTCMDDSTSGGGSGTSTTGGTDSGGTGTGTGGDTDTTGGQTLPSEGIESLDWSYVCSGHLTNTQSSARISGLDNGQVYQILVVAYDRAGNPTAASGVLTATPRETSDFWEQCQLQGNVCGNGGYCSCSTDEPRPLGALGFLLGGLIGLGGVWRRRRTR